MTIPVWDYRAEYEAERDDILAAVDQVMRSGRLILGESVRAFEQELAAYCGAGHGVGVNSGTDALMLALRALDIRPGDEVITTSNTAIPTVAAIVSAGGDAAVRRHRAGHVPDGRVAARIGDHAAYAVHRAGAPVRAVRRHGRGATRSRHDTASPVSKTARRAPARSTADGGRDRCRTLAAFSFYPTKILGAYGDGGMVVTSDAALAARLRRLRVYGTEGTYYAEEHGYNSRLDELHAEILRRKLRRIDATSRAASRWRAATTSSSAKPA